MKQQNNKLYILFKHLCNYHHQGVKPSIFIFSTPRSGSTWLIELMLTQRGLKSCSEPFNLRMDAVANSLDIHDWDLLYSDSALPRIEQHINSFLKGELRGAYKNRYPWQRYYRPFTNRMVFKILHAGHEKIDWFINTFKAQVVYLTRHPIPVALSRRELPRLSTFLNSEYSHFFTKEQLAIARRIAAEGPHIQKAVLDWCLHNSVALKRHLDKIIFVTYEQLVLDPEPVINVISRQLELNDTQRMLEKISAPSGSVNQSNKATNEALASKTLKGNPWLIEKWRTAVDVDEEKKLMSLLEIFDIDVYKFGSFVPVDKYWLR